MKTGNGFGHPPGFWNDMDDADSFGVFQPTAGVVEVVPEPACLVLALISAGAMPLSPARRCTLDASNSVDYLDWLPPSWP